MNDEEDQLALLIERLNGGDLAAAEDVFRTYEPFLRMAVRRQLSGPLRAKLDTMDIVQAVWADLIAGLNRSGWKFNDPAQLRAFLKTLARNRLIDRRRHYRRALELEVPLMESESPDLPASIQPRPSEIASKDELWERLLAICPPEHRDILVLKRDGVPIGEIAARKQMHEGSVRRIISRVKEKLIASQPGRFDGGSDQPES